MMKTEELFWGKQMLYRLDFMIGNIPCTLVNTQPYNTHENRRGTYYEHYHSFFELHYIEVGSAVYLCNNGKVLVKEGELLIIPPRMYHEELYSAEGTQKNAISLNISAVGANATPADIFFYNTFSRINFYVMHVGGTPLECEILRLKALATTADSYVTREKMRATAHCLTILLYEMLSQSTPHENGGTDDSTLSREYEIDTFLALNFMYNSSRKELAEQLHVSPRQLNRIMKKSYGKSYREKLLEVRLEIALSFLYNTDKSITEISEELGYSNPTSFTSFIKTATGKTPSALRKKG